MWSGIVSCADSLSYIAFSQGVYHSKRNETRIAITQQSESKLKNREGLVMWTLLWEVCWCESTQKGVSGGLNHALPVLKVLGFVGGFCTKPFNDFIVLIWSHAFLLACILNSVFFKSSVLFPFFPLYLSVGLDLEWKEVLLYPCWGSCYALLRLTQNSGLPLESFGSGVRAGIWCLGGVSFEKTFLDTPITTGFTIAVLLCPRRVRQWNLVGTGSCPGYPWLILTFGIPQLLSPLTLLSWESLCVCFLDENDIEKMCEVGILDLSIHSSFMHSV